MQHLKSGTPLRVIDVTHPLRGQIIIHRRGSMSGSASWVPSIERLIGILWDRVEPIPNGVGSYGESTHINHDSQYGDDAEFRRAFTDYVIASGQTSVRFDVKGKRSWIHKRR